MSGWGREARNNTSLFISVRAMVSSMISPKHVRDGHVYGPQRLAATSDTCPEQLNVKKVLLREDSRKAHHRQLMVTVKRVGR